HLLVSEQVRGYILQHNPLALGDKLRFGGSRECLRLWRRDVEILIGASLRRWRQRLQQSLSSRRSFTHSICGLRSMSAQLVFVSGRIATRTRNTFPNLFLRRGD